VKGICIALLAGVVGCAFVQTVPAAEAAKFKENVLYAFGNLPDGEYPHRSVIDVKGTLYGTTYGGGTSNSGTIFSLSRATGAENVLYAFDGEQNGYPTASLISVKGTLYGTASGVDGLGGMVFSLDLNTGAEKTVYGFCSQPNCTDGEYPQSNLIDVKGKLYGTTYEGGNNNGTVFSINLKTGAEKVLHSFASGTDGAQPQAGLIDVNGTLYGTTTAGGGYGCGNDLGCGTVFSIDPNTGVETVLHSFGTGPDGVTPYAGLIDVNGTLYGTTVAGGAYGQGTVFVIDSNTGAEKVLYSFLGGTDGTNPFASLTDVKGTLYGTTSYGGAYGQGTAFSINLNTGAETVRHSFGSGTDGANPYDSLIDVKGTLFGTTESGGAYGHGIVFALKKR
jgi:uncharacterized repeat protein (TIGR03803 family)